MEFMDSRIAGLKLLTRAALSTFPAGLYLLIEKVLLHRNTAVVGARYVLDDSNHK